MNVKPGQSAIVAILSMCVVACASAGCKKAISKLSPKKTWHERCHWRADDYFDDPQVIALCHAIEKNDVAEFDRIVTAGANVNAQGKGKMTPLLWAYPDNKLARFKRLLELGADPNVITESDFGTKGAIAAGTSVTHLAARTRFNGYFDAVFAHGGDPNVESQAILHEGDTPLLTLLKAPTRDKRRKARLLIDKGADVNHIGISGLSPPMEAFAFQQYGIALELLEAGADPSVCQWLSNRRLAHIVAANLGSARSERWSPQQRADVDELYQWLEDHGESMELARADNIRWHSWSTFNGEYRRNMDAEVAERKKSEPPLRPKEFFEDAQVIALCHAIDANDLDEVERLVANGANINAQGEGKMTPLLWAFPPKWMLSVTPDRLKTFQLLLKLGANPNVGIRPNGAMRGDWLLPGDSVTHMAAATKFPGYFEAVFDDGGDVNLVGRAPGTVGDTPIFTVIKGKAADKAAKIEQLIEKGADIDHRNLAGATACMEAATRDQFDVILVMLKSGADFEIAHPGTHRRLVEMLIEKEQVIRSLRATEQKEYASVMDWLNSHGEPIAKAREDLEQAKRRAWRSL